MPTIEQQIAYAMLGSEFVSILGTDAYKLAMAQAGAPLRDEIFNSTFREPGAYYVPFDLAAVATCLQPNDRVTIQEDAFLRRFESNGYDLTPAMLKALVRPLKFRAAPKGSWFFQGEPYLVTQGASSKASWMEPSILWLNFPIQIATAAMRGERFFKATCGSEHSIIALTLRACGIHDFQIQDCEAEYRQECREHAEALVKACKGANLFEVGMRAATCMEMHQIAVEECQKAGIKATSSLLMAFRLGMQPVGTTGHEHPERWGSDIAGYRAIRDMRPRSPSYLPDTFDADRIGLPAAVQVIKETPDRECFVRFDERDKIARQLDWLYPQVKDLPVDFIFEDGIRPPMVETIQAACDALGIDMRRRHFGSGGYLVTFAGRHRFGRDDVQAVYKLSKTGTESVMKTSSPEKASCPGNPVIFRRLKGHNVGALYTDCIGVIGQEGEPAPGGFALLDPSDPNQMLPAGQSVRHSIGRSFDTIMLQRVCRERLEKMLQDFAPKDA